MEKKGKSAPRYLTAPWSIVDHYLRGLRHQKRAEIGNRKKNGNGEKGEERSSLFNRSMVHC